MMGSAELGYTPDRVQATLGHASARAPSRNQKAFCIQHVAYDFVVLEHVVQVQTIAVRALTKLEGEAYNKS